jgi:hypothetical protein
LAAEQEQIWKRRSHGNKKVKLSEELEKQKNWKYWIDIYTAAARAVAETTIKAGFDF